MVKVTSSIQNGLVVYHVYVNGTKLNTYMSEQQAKTKQVLYNQRLAKSKGTIKL